MRSLVVDMVGMVGLCVLGVVCLVGVVGWGRVWGVCLWGVRGVIVESVCWVGVRVGLGKVGRKKTYYLVAPFEIADFRGE